MLDNLKNKNIILASQSPRRKELLSGLDIKFQVKPLYAKEDYNADLLKRENITEFLCDIKAKSFEQWEDNTILITADTIVWLGNKALEKPRNRGEAISMLEELSGKNHEVISSTGIYSRDKNVIVTDITKVFFANINNDEISYYVDKYSPYDKAGSYGVQEWIGYIGVERIEGSYYTVMGLPLSKVYNALKEF